MSQIEDTLNICVVLLESDYSTPDRNATVRPSSVKKKASPEVLLSSQAGVPNLHRLVPVDHNRELLQFQLNGEVHSMEDVKAGCGKFGGSLNFFRSSGGLP